MSSDRTYQPNDRPIRSDQRQPPRGAPSIRSDADSRRRHLAGEYGEGREDESTGVGPRRADAPPQVLNDSPGNADTYGNVAPGRYGVHGYSSSPGHPSAYVGESGEPRPQMQASRAAQTAQTAQTAHATPASQTRSAANADERLRELIRERLTEDPDIDAGDVIVLVSEGRVTLSGSVVDEHTRDVIEQCVENCGARAVDNHLLVS